MRKILLSFAIVFTISCSEPKIDCKFSTLEITVEKENKEPKKVILKGCYTISEPDELGLITIKGNNDSTRVHYDTASTMLTIITEDGPASEWRTRKGDNIFVADKKDTLGFVFGNLKTNFKGSLLFIK